MQANEPLGDFTRVIRVWRAQPVSGRNGIAHLMRNLQTFYPLPRYALVAA